MKPLHIIYVFVFVFIRTVFSVWVLLLFDHMQPISIIWIKKKKKKKCSSGSYKTLGTILAHFHIICS